MKEQSTHFREMLLEFAREIGKEDAEVYVDEGYWKARQGGNGVAYAQKSVIAFEPCATQENTYNYELQKPIETEFYELFRPFGYLNYELGNERLGEVYILGKNGVPQLKLQGRIGTKKLKVTLLNQKITEDKIKCQITKYQMCMGCLACESVCRHDAISIKEDDDGNIHYQILDEKCVRCRECVSHFSAGCYMRKVLTIKRN